MKLWFRYLLGTAVGVAAGILVPLAGGDTLQILEEISGFVFRIGRFLLFPLAFFSIIIAVDELRDDRRVASVAIKTGLASVATVVAAVIVGVLVMVIFQPQRIPPMVQEAAIAAPPQMVDIIRQSVPMNLFRVFVLGDNALGMILLVGVLIGWTLRFDREISSSVALVSDSANRILYRLNRSFTSLLGFLLAIPGGMIIVRIRDTADLQLFGQFLIVVITAAVIIGMVVYPVMLYLLKRDGRMATGWVTRMGAPGLAALVSGDVFFAAATLARVGKEELRLPRRIGGSVSYISAVFLRAGSALVAVASFLLVIRSYTALEIGFLETLMIAATAIGSSFLLGRTPAGGVTLLLSYLAVSYGRGMDESFLILLPVLPFLERLGAWLDVMTHGFIAFLVAESEGIRHGDKPLSSTLDGAAF